MPFWLTVPATIYRPVGQADKDLGTPRSVHLQDTDATTAYESFGVEIVNGRVLYDSPDAASLYDVGGRVVAGGRVYSIRAVPRNWPEDVLGFDSGANHIMVLLEEVRE